MVARRSRPVIKWVVDGALVDGGGGDDDDLWRDGLLCAQWHCRAEGGRRCSTMFTSHQQHSLCGKQSVDQ